MSRRPPVLLALAIVSIACSQSSKEMTAQAASPNTVSIPGGVFLAGHDDGDPGRRTAVQPFAIDRSEVTVAAYAGCVAAGKCRPAGTAWKTCNWSSRDAKANHPINCVTWIQANDYCLWAGERLPTETEWEFAARGTDARPYPWGTAAPAAQVCSGRNRQGTCPVASNTGDKSPFGALDMAGNVKEWTSTSETSPEGVKLYAIRGGGWLYDGLTAEMPVRVTERDTLPPTDNAADVGFRCAAGK